MNQLAMLLPQPRARHSDPASSQEARIKAKRFHVGHAQRIYDYLVSIHPAAAHAETIGDAIGLDSVKVARRFKAMREAKLIEDAGRGYFRNGNAAGMVRAKL